MIDDLKTIVLFMLMAIASAYVHYKGFFQATIDAVLAFCMGYLSNNELGNCVDKFITPTNYNKRY